MASKRSFSWTVGSLENAIDVESDEAGDAVLHLHQIRASMRAKKQQAEKQGGGANIEVISVASGTTSDGEDEHGDAHAPSSVEQLELYRRQQAARFQKAEAAAPVAAAEANVNQLTEPQKVAIAPTAMASGPTMAAKTDVALGAIASAPAMAPSVVEEAWLGKLVGGLDADQRAAVMSAKAGRNVVIIGPGGAGKSKTLACILAVLDRLGKNGTVGTPTHAARRVLIKGLQKEGMAVEVMTLARLFGCMPGEKIEAQAIAAKVLANAYPGRGAAQRASKGDYIMIDEAGQLDPFGCEQFVGGAQLVRQNKYGLNSVAQLIMGLDVMQNLPVVQLSLSRLLLESKVVTQGEFDIVYLKGNYRNNDPRMHVVLEKLAVECFDDDVMDFFTAASNVKLACEVRGAGAINEFELEPEQRCYHWVSQNHEVVSVGEKWYSNGASETSGDLQIWYMFRDHESKEEQTICKALLKNKYLWKIALRRNGIYSFVSTDDDAVEIDGVRFTPGERLRFVERVGSRKFRFDAIDREGEPEVELSEFGMHVKGWAASVWDGPRQYYERNINVLPFTYDHVGTSFKAQARASGITWAHVGYLKGEDNQLYTMVSRAEGSPWAKTLKISGIQGPAAAKMDDIKKKMKVYPKSLLLMHLFGRKVAPEKIMEARMHPTVKNDPNFLAIMDALRAKLV